jgi:hypothetical protein
MSLLRASTILKFGFNGGRVLYVPCMLVASTIKMTVATRLTIYFLSTKVQLTALKYFRMYTNPEDPFYSEFGGKCL